MPSAEKASLFQYIKKLWRRIRKIKPRQEAGAFDLLSEKKFLIAIQRECARSDRNRQGFSLVIFDVGQNHANNNPVTCALLDALGKRLRITDEAGWFKEHYIGILLYATPIKESAWLFVNAIWNILEEKLDASPKCIVYSYPEDWRYIEIEKQHEREIPRQNLQNDLKNDTNDFKNSTVEQVSSS
ncbi:hypothetical protein [Candidatus Venteria ishoeyi]|uniref:GGDEF domain-containing protein n=1 Tax=Candidatus Venteria ishoeyi TaxID=1899563 RepID=A0A1H6FEE1_9GAMM|nr:hypothetical protein [Candidatus Venteria ishoeyi]MDM8546147.1 hypothetical protein [Candidatus Venteria ishoeyi]SEH08013.1 Uncharacterised protein [Candidatus Venteria ishoeyi]